MKNNEKLRGKLKGNNRENIPDFAFKLMTFVMKLFDIFGNHSNKNFRTLDLKSGQTVIDYGCGPARYVKNASESVGKKGKVIAVDIQPLAIKKVNDKITAFGLTNVEAILADGYSASILSETADVVYALDMFHMIENPDSFLKELYRLVKPDGIIIIEDGHQPRSKTKLKIENSNLLDIVEENKFHVKCRKKG